MAEVEIQNTDEWSKDEAFIAELDMRNQAMESGTDKGVTMDELKEIIAKLKAARK